MSKASDLARLMTSGSTAIHGEAGVTASGSTGLTTNLQQGLTKAWANFTTLTSFASNDTFNVSSVTDTSAGVSDGNFTNNMSNLNYSGSASAERPALYVAVMSSVINPATDHLTVGNAIGSTNAALDCDHVYFSINGDLA
tara:strand:+ start:379 stop:798 length:420 start_codon:yes stop_codon:yes gene_type:complete